MFEPIKSKTFPGFYEIPHFNKYVITEKGELLHKATKYFKKLRQKYDGYLVYTLYDNNGKKYVLGRYRLLCLAFKYRPDWRELQINHIDNNRRNDSLDNLEWSTPKDNWDHGWEHGQINKNHSKAIAIRNVWSGEVKIFDQLQEAAKYLNVSPATITLYLKQLYQPIVPGFFQVKLVHDLRPWRQVNDPWLELMEYTKEKVIQVINTKTGEVRMFPSAAECARACNLKVTTLSERLKTGKGLIIYKDGCKYGYYPMLT